MSLKFVIGGAGSGKTKILYQDLIARSLAEPQAQFIAIVPEQFTMQTQKEIVTMHPAGGTMNIDIVSFNRLAYRVFEEMPLENPAVLDDMGKSMVLRKVAEEQKRNLGLYGGHLNQAGFISRLKSMVSELYQYGIGPEELRKVEDAADSALLKEKCRDLERICMAFRKETEGRFITAEEILNVLCRILPQSRMIRRSVITLDGYTGFTPVQYRLLELMMVHARQVIVTVTADPQDHPYRRGKKQELFYMGKEMISRLTDLASKNGVSRDKDVILNAPLPNPSIAFIEKNLYRYGRNGFEAEPRGVEVWEAQSAAGEVAAAAAEIRRMVREEGLRYREIAVITGDLPGYRSEIVSRFQKEGIPCFLDDKKSILENVMVEFIRAAIEAVRRDFDYESMFRWLKTGLVTDDREELDRLENYCLAMGIRGFGRWSQTWEYVARGCGNLNLDRLNCFRAGIVEPLAELRETFRQEDRTVSAMTQAVIRFLERCGVQEKLARYQEDFERQGEYSLSREYQQVYDRVMEMFGRLTQLLGEERVSVKEYGEILDAGFGEIQVGVIPATVDRVVAGDITRTRLDRIRVLFFLGVNEGVVPGRKDSQGLLTDMDREVFKQCGMELAPTSREDSFNQRYYLYLALTKPSGRLILSYSLLDQGGKSRRPSSLIGELKRLFPLLTVKEAERVTAQILSPTGGKDFLIRGLRSYAAGRWDENPDAQGEENPAGQGDVGAERRRFSEVYRWFFRQPEYRDMVKSLTDAAFYSYEGSGIGRAAACALYGRVLQGNVTRLERYAACAYAHFLKYGLELEERQEYRIQAADMGNLFHSAIELCFRTARERGISLVSLSERERRELVSRSVEEVTSGYGNTILKSSARNQYLAERIERITERTVWALTEQLKKGDFQPEEFEVFFTSADNPDAMRIRLSEDEELRLQGRIDRLDLCRDGRKLYVRIIDYKSGATDFDLSAVYWGLQLQLVVYLDAALERTGRKNPDSTIIPAGIFYYHIKDPIIEREPGQTPGDIDAGILRELRLSGLVNSDMEAIHHLDGGIEDSSDVIPVAVKDGLLQESRSSVASGGRFEMLRQHVRKQLEQDGREILEGRIPVLPQKQGSRTACDYCPYHGVCGFDTRISGYRFRRFPAIEKEEIWDRITQETGGDAEEKGGAAADAVDRETASGH